MRATGPNVVGEPLTGGRPHGGLLPVPGHRSRMLAGSPSRMLARSEVEGFGDVGPGDVFEVLAFLGGNVAAVLDDEQALGEALA